MKVCCFFAAFCPTSTTYRPIWNCVSETASNKLLMSLLILQLLQHSSTAHFHCRRRRRLHPHLLLIVYHQKELPRRLLCLRIPVRTSRFTSKWHPCGAHPNPTNIQWIPESSVCLFLLQTLSFSNKILIFSYSIFCCIHRLHPFFRENFLWLREREKVNFVFLKKYLYNNNNNNNNDLTSRLLQNFLLEESSVDEGYTNSWSSGVQFSPKCRWTFQYRF